MIKKEVQDQILRAPKEVGVYLFRNVQDQIIYVGKALNLQNRLKSYIHPHSDTRPSIVKMVPKVAAVEWLLTDNEKEAFILENNLIKTNRPRYNIMYRDDKSYISLKVTKHAYPRLYKTRTIEQGQGQYFGPFSSGASVNRTLTLLQKLFLVRDCTDSFFKNRSRPCLRYQIKRCSAPCVGFVTKDQYLEQVLQVVRFMKGQYQEIKADLEKKMKQASASMDYERASLYRDQLFAIEETLKPQKAQVHNKHPSMDIIGIFGDEHAVLIQRLEVRDGKIKTAQQALFDESIAFEADVLRSFLQQYYLSDLSNVLIPDEIILPQSIQEQAVIQSLFTQKKGKKVRLTKPLKGHKKKYLDLALRNAESSFLEKKRKSQKNEKTLEDLATLLKLAQKPYRIEGYDISNLQGGASYGSQVVFINGEKDISQYRIYSIQTVEGPNDFASLKEVLMRRLAKTKNNPLPDLLLIDGGRAQLTQAINALKENNLNINVVSIAKEKTIKTKSKVRYAPERLYKPNQKNPIVLPVSSPVLQLIQRIRDEAHRFGLKHHRQKRSKMSKQSVLEEIQGVGPKRAKALLKEFKSIDALCKVSVDEIQQRAKINKELATTIKNYLLHNQ